MIAVSWEQAPDEFREDAVQTRAVGAGEMRIAFERLAAGLATADFFRGLPGDACQSPHWGYIVKGRIRFITAEGERLMEAGQAYYVPPGHNFVVEEDVELVEFSPPDARRATLDHVARQLEAAGA